MNWSQEAIAEATTGVVHQISHDVRGVGSLMPTTTNRVVRLAVEIWPPLVPLSYPNVARDAHVNATRAIRARVREQYEARYGCGVIATILLSAIIQQVVAAIIRRWWANNSSFRQQVRLAQWGLKNEH